MVIIFLFSFTMKLFIFDLFAGTFSVTKTCFDLNQTPNFQNMICSILALEKSENLVMHFLKEYIQTAEFEKKKPQFFQIYRGSIRSKDTQSSFFQNFEQTLQIILETTEKKESIGILIFSGPPCTYYSSLQGLKVQTKYMRNPQLFVDKQNASDALVLKTLEYYQKTKEKSEYYSQKYDRSIFTELIIENPWSVGTFRIPYENDLFFQKGYQYQTPLALRKRPFLQPFLFENGGILEITKHHWCVYDFERFPPKPTAIFSTLSTLQSQKCTHTKQKHPVTVMDLSTAAARGKYPPQFIEYCISCFLTK